MTKFPSNKLAEYREGREGEGGGKICREICREKTFLSN